MKLVILESPYAGNIVENIKYARLCIRDSLLKGEAPIASHLLYTQESILNDNLENERMHGINAGLSWLKVADLHVCYIDKGISKGMAYGIEAAKKFGLQTEYRKLYK